MELIDQYFELQRKIYNYFGYTEDWVIIPLRDYREYYWHLTGDGHGDWVYFAETEKQLLESDGDYYGYEVYTQRFLKEWVWRGPEYTMICSDTHSDGNKLLSIFSNELERQPASDRQWCGM